jgi:sulfhydrogenase subunit gamma (sulfur reductase)
MITSNALNHITARVQNHVHVNEELFTPINAWLENIKQLTALEKVFSLRLPDGTSLNHRPGQFVEVSSLGIGEAPISISSSPSRSNGVFEICVRKVGDVTSALHNLKVGESVGIRGPYGRGFPYEKFRGKDILFAPGGLGLAPLRSLINQVLDERALYGRVIILYGARNPSELLFKDELKEWGDRDDVELHLTVDRGDETWTGHIGVITTLFRDISVYPRNTVAITVGPPVMYRFVLMELLGKGISEGNIWMSLDQMIRISDLVHVPAIDEAISRQYSEGCFTTWDPQISGLIATITGSARPVDKDNLTDDEIAVIVGVRPDGLGALVRNVEGKRNDPPSSEAVEMIEMDLPLPKISVHVQADGLVSERGTPGNYTYEVPVARSKLHGHRGVSSFNPQLVEHVSLDEPFYHFPVSCSTEAQARAIRDAYARSEALNDPKDLRQVIFTVLPGHGVVIAEKWVPGKLPFQVIWEFMDSGDLQIENYIPQGPLTYELNNNGMMVLKDQM